MTRPTKPAADKREQFLLANQRGFAGVTLPPKAIDDLKYFEEQAKKGRAIRTDALLNWLKTTYEIDVGQSRLYRLAVEAGVMPWWSKR